MRRRVTSWALRRPRNTAIIVAVAVAALFGVSQLFNTPAQREDTRNPTERLLAAAPTVGPINIPTVEEAVALVPTDTVEEHSAGESVDELDPAVEATAREFVAAWLDTDDPLWPETMADYATVDLVAKMYTVDPGNVPDGEVLDSTPVVVGAFYAQVDVLVAEDRTVEVELTLLDDWRVVNIL